MKVKYVIEIESFDDGLTRHGNLKVYLDDSDKFNEYRLINFSEEWNRDIEDMFADINFSISATNKPNGSYSCD